jgi:hypothetical protein
MTDVEEWAEIRRLRRAEGMSIKVPLRRGVGYVASRWSRRGGGDGATPTCGIRYSW